MPPRKRRTPQGSQNATRNEAPLETPAGALATDEGGRPRVDDGGRPVTQERDK